jgi:hypothetical protein
MRARRGAQGPDRAPRRGATPIGRRTLQAQARHAGLAAQRLGELLDIARSQRPPSREGQERAGLAGRPEPPEQLLEPLHAERRRSRLARGMCRSAWAQDCRSATARAQDHNVAVAAAAIGSAASAARSNGRPGFCHSGPGGAGCVVARRSAWRCWGARGLCQVCLARSGAPFVFWAGRRLPLGTETTPRPQNRPRRARRAASDWPARAGAGLRQPANPRTNQRARPRLHAWTVLGPSRRQRA